VHYTAVLACFRYSKAAISHIIRLLVEGTLSKSVKNWTLVEVEGLGKQMGDRPSKIESYVYNFRDLSSGQKIDWRNWKMAKIILASLAQKKQKIQEKFFY